MLYVSMMYFALPMSPSSNWPTRHPNHPPGYQAGILVLIPHGICPWGTQCVREKRTYGAAPDERRKTPKHQPSPSMTVETLEHKE